MANMNALKHLLPVFGDMKLANIKATQIEVHLRTRLKQRKKVHRKENSFPGLLKPATVHQEFPHPASHLSVAVKKKLCQANPCDGVEFPVMIKSLFRPHFVTWSEQEKIEAVAAPYLRNVIRIVTETGLRVYKELAPLRKEQVDLANRIVYIADSKTPTWIADVRLPRGGSLSGPNENRWSGPMALPQELCARSS